MLFWLKSPTQYLVPEMYKLLRCKMQVENFWGVNNPHRLEIKFESNNKLIIYSFWFCHLCKRQTTTTLVLAITVLERAQDRNVFLGRPVKILVLSEGQRNVQHKCCNNAFLQRMSDDLLCLGLFAPHPLAIYTAKSSYSAYRMSYGRMHCKYTCPHRGNIDLFEL